MKHLILHILILIPINLFAQINGIVKNKKTGNPIEYANIWVENQNLGTTSNEKGQFFFKEKVLSKTLIVSAIGYETMKTIVESDNLNIELNPKSYEIEEVIVHPKKRNELVINEFKKSSIHNYLMSSLIPWNVAKYFKYSSDYAKTPYLKSLKILTNSGVNNAIFNLRIILADEKGEPTEDILKNNLIVKVKKGKRKLIIDLTEFQIAFPKNGFFISIESLILDNNKREFVYTMEGSSKKIHSVQYDPMFGTVLKDENIPIWISESGKWRSTIMKNRNKGKTQDLAIELILSD